MSGGDNHSKALAKALNAYLSPILPAAPPPPTLDDEIERLIRVHGKDAVRESIRQATKAKRGRKPDPDWKYLGPIIQSDADLWLDGEDPCASPRTNYAIAQAISEANPGHSATSTHRRIMGKLAKKRKLFFLITAENKAQSERPMADYLRTVEELARYRPDDSWTYFLERARTEFDRYRQRDGEPDPKLSFAAIQEANRKAPEPASLPFATGLAGLLGYDPRKL